MAGQRRELSDTMGVTALHAPQSLLNGITPLPPHAFLPGISWEEFHHPIGDPGILPRCIPCTERMPRSADRPSRKGRDLHRRCSWCPVVTPASVSATGPSSVPRSNQFIVRSDSAPPAHSLPFRITAGG